MSDAEIARVTSYIKDDKYIASIYGTNVHRVKRLRENHKQTNNPGVAGDAIGMDSVNSHKSSMKAGSARLLEMIMNERGGHQ